MRSREYTIGTGITQRQVLEVQDETSGIIFAGIRTGITQRQVSEVLRTSGEDFFMALARLFPQQFVEWSPEATDQLELFDDLDPPESALSMPFDDAMADLKAEAEQVLRDAGLPVAVRQQVCLLPDGSTRDDLHDLTSAVDVITVTMHTPSPDKVDSREWYAAQFCNMLVELQNARESTNWQQALYAAWKIGSLQKEFAIKMQWESPALSGKKSADGARASGKTRKDTTKSGLPKTQRDAEVLQSAAELRQKNPNLSAWSLAKRLAQHPNKTRWQIGQRQLYRIIRSS